MRAAGCDAWAGARGAGGDGADRGAAAPAASLRLRAMLRARDLRAADPTCSSASMRRVQPGRWPAAASAGHRDRAVRQPAGMGVAAGAGRRHRARGCDLVLCLLPFEPSSTRATACGRVRRSPAGRPDAARARSRRSAARAWSSAPSRDRWWRLLPGSRAGRGARLAADSSRAAAGIAAARPGRVASSRRWPTRRARALFERALARVARRASRFASLDGQARRRSPPRMRRSWPPAPRRSRRCCAAVRWWSPTASARVTAFVAARPGLVQGCRTFRCRICWPGGAGAGILSGGGDRRSARRRARCASSRIRRATRAAAAEFAAFTEPLRAGRRRRAAAGDPAS